jgi:ABC-type cobalamin/Fe3+-siderophores transport system ATPase subunit
MWTMKLTNWPPVFLAQNLRQTIEIRSGGLVLVQGPNGVGKSTLLKCLAMEAHRSGIKFFLLPQLANPQFPLSLTLGEALNSFGAAPDDFLVRHLDLNRSWKTASGGERARVLISGAFHQPAKLLLMDEPDQSLDGESRRAVSIAIQNWLSANPERACVVVSHSEVGWESSQKILLEEVL